MDALTGVAPADPDAPSGTFRPAETGYASALYPQSLAEFGEPVELPSSGGWFLKRAIPGADLFDGMGCYPYLACRSWAGLGSDLDDLRGRLVSFCGVPDPFGDFHPQDLAEAFDKVIHFKDHYVADLSRPLEEIISAANLKAAEKALQHIDVEFHDDPAQLLDLWTDLYADHIRRFSLTGLKAFSAQSFRQQLQVPGAVVSIAKSDGRPVAAHMQMVQDGVCHAHLSCALPEANRLGVSYALYLSEILHYRERVRWIDWGGDPGAVRKGPLGSFKRGWSNARRPAYFCARILDRGAYDRLSTGRSTAYFPAYRDGELA